MDSDLVDLIDESDRTVGTVTRKEMRAGNLLHRTSFILVFNSALELFVTKRSSYKDYAPGRLEIAQGGVAAKGESYFQNAQRELSEELGIKPKLRFLFDLKYLGSQTNYLAKVYICKWDGTMLLQETEIESGTFVSLVDLKPLIKTQPDRFTPDTPLIFKSYLDFSGSKGKY
ncbi:NUDIX domain-containing protein [Candidatus Micrarchaeota archaeon]|nr:NUDIX domain-containing protein [Candidatus Micrarchaeota archaeon]